MHFWIGLALTSLIARPVTADPAAYPGAPGGEAAEEPEPDAAAIAARVDELEAKLRIAEQGRRSQFPVKITGYGDLGLFATQGDGSGFRRDAGHVMFPDRSQYAWVFYGDLLATTVNSRGDTADLGDAPGVDRFDSIHSHGAPSFLVNELNLSINAGLGSHALFTSSVNFTPRSGANFSLGDAFDLDLAQLEWIPTEDGNTSLFVGKVDSVIGIEYKTRKAPQRFGITPTLLARYTTGTAIGVKARSKFADDRIILSAAITNGSFGTEQFHFYDEVDSNTFKTVSARAALKLGVGSGHLEFGPSGQWGTQDGAPDGAGAMWLVGVDAELDLGRIDLRAQWITGKAPGDEVSRTYGLDLKQGGYLEADLIVTPVIGLLGRAEFRDAEVHQGMERLYITKNWRATAGVRLSLNANAIVKAEVSHNGEYGGVPSIPDDVVTTSAV
ncbi:MAG TPA: hypothetical protein VK601_04535, partial [Kofleriaceae bacterium]|nr:hypothetical protein [Kofleriaceae bacterium]